MPYLLEVSTLEFVKNEFLTNNVNLGIGSNFSKGPMSVFSEGPGSLYKVCLFWLLFYFQIWVLCFYLCSGKYWNLLQVFTGSLLELFFMLMFWNECLAFGKLVSVLLIAADLKTSFHRRKLWFLVQMNLYRNIVL